MKYLSAKRRRDFKRRRWQILAAGATIFIGVLLYAASFDAYQNLNRSYLGTYQRLAFADMTVTGANTSFPQTAKALAGVAEVTTRKQADVPFKVGKTDLLGRVVGMPPGEQPSVNRVDVVRGTYLTGARDEVIADVHMADHFGLSVGDTLRIMARDGFTTVRLVGVGVSPEYIWPARSSQDVLTNPDDFGVLYAPEGLLAEMPSAYVVDQDLVLYEPGADRETLDARLKALARRTGAADAVARKDQASNKAINLDVDGFQQMAYAFPVVFLLAAGLATYTLLMRLVYAERAVIGTLRANGLSRDAVVRHYLSYGLWIGGLSSLAGVALGVPLGWATTAAYTAELGIPDTIRAVYPLTPVVGILFGVLTGALAAWLPARAAASIAPAEAMRGDAEVMRGHASLLEIVLPPLRRLPARWRMVLRAIGRSRRRSASTILGVVLALVLLLSSWGMLDTTQKLLNDQFNGVQLEDASIAFVSPVTDQVVADVGRIRGVSAAERTTLLDVTVVSATDSYATALYGYAHDTKMHTFPTGPPPTDGVVLGKSLRVRLGVEQGDEVTLRVGSLDTKVRTRVAAFADEPLGSLAYMDRDALTRALSEASTPVGAARLVQPDAAVVLARFDPSVDRGSVLSRIKDLSSVAAVTDSRALYDQAKQYMGLFYVFVGLMLAFGGLMAFALIFSTMSVNLAERVSELAALRANGMSGGQVARLIVGENMLLTAVAIPFGLVAGFWAAGAMMQSFSSDLFSFALYIRPATYVWCALSMFAVTAISLWPGLRSTDRLDIATVVRERSA